MKRLSTFTWGAVVALVLIVAAAVYAAQGPGGGRGVGGRGGPGGFGPAGINLRGLDLTDAQRDQIRQIMQRYQEQMRTEIMAVLTPEQQQRVQQEQAQRQQRLQERQQRQQQRQPQQQQPRN